jgi:hypothetical protein
MPAQEFEVVGGGGDAARIGGSVQHAGGMHHLGLNAAVTSRTRVTW